MMRLRQLQVDRAWFTRRVKSEEKVIATPLARCASVIPRRGTPDATGFASSCQGGRFAPRCIPQTRSFAPWTSPDALRLLDCRPGGVSPSGHLTAVSTAASTRRAFVPSMDLQTVGDFALPPDPHRPGVCRLGPARGFCAHRPQRGFRAPAPRTGGVPPRCPCPTVPIGCARPEDAP
jgi:hypothetical protein